MQNNITQTLGLETTQPNRYAKKTCRTTAHRRANTTIRKFNHESTTIQQSQGSSDLTDVKP